MIPSGISGVVPIAEMRGDDEQETALLHAAAPSPQTWITSSSITGDIITLCGLCSTQLRSLRLFGRELEPLAKLSASF